MPGHKRNSAFAGAYAKTDITEICGADNLLAPEGIIRGLQRKLAALYGADESFILVNGSTVGIEAAVLYFGEIIMARNSHRSAYGGLILSGAKPMYIYPDIIDGIVGAIMPRTIEDALDAAPDAAAVFITSPTFEGYCADIAKIAEVVHKRGIPLIVDEAHGAHFGFHPAFPVNATRLGADIVIQSLHKTLPVPGQCSVLHVKGALIDAKKIKDCVNILQTSSPSYFFMAEIERCVELLQTRGLPLFVEYNARLARFREAAAGLKNIRLLTDTEPGKLTFRMTGGISGVGFGKLLRERGIELEMLLPGHAVAMTSVADTDSGFERLLAAVREVDRLADGTGSSPDTDAVYRARPRRAAIPRDAFFAGKTSRALSGAVGRTAGSFVIPYPPGVPLIVPGEIVTEEIIREAERLLDAGADVLGADIISVIAREVEPC
jgi:arginine/lysine/ornithine decarboxylase